MKKVNFAKVRSATSARSYRRGLAALAATAAVAGAVSAASAQPGAASQERPPAAPGPRITLAVLPGDTTHRALGSVEGISPGALSAGLGSVPIAQTFLDISQGNRIFGSLYDYPLPALFTVEGRVPPRTWDSVAQRAADAPADVVPGLLASTILAAPADATTAPAAVADPLAGLAGLVVVDEAGRIGSDAGCPRSGCPGLNVAAAGLRRLPALIARLRGEDVLIALERPPPEAGRLLSIGIAGEGFDGLLTSDSTRMPGLVLTSDIGPTVLGRLGIAVPSEMSGSPIRTEGGADPDEVASLEGRLIEVRPRRGPVIGTNVLVWVALTVLAAALLGARGARVALALLALSAVYLPALLLVTAALEPSELAERLIVGLGAPLLAAATLAVLRGYAAIAVACGVTVLAYAVDVVAGSPFTALSLMGPNPALGVRFYGIGNELEATLAPLVLLGTGAGIAAWSRARDSAGTGPAAAFGFGIACLLAIVAFAPGRFGADVGAAIVLAVGGGVAAAVVLGAMRRRTLLLLVAAPLVALAALAVADLVLGGDAHLSRSVLEAGGLDEVAQVAERRLRLSAASFQNTFGSPFLFVAVALIIAAVVFRDRIASWFEGARAALAGFVGAAAAIAVGTLANDSGVLLLMIGTGFLALFAGCVWATRAGAEAGSPGIPRAGDDGPNREPRA